MSPQSSEQMCGIRIKPLAGDGTPLAPRRQPLTAGIPWPKGMLRAASSVYLEDANGAAAPVQARPLDFWPDGSVRWALLDWQMSIPAGGAEVRAGVCNAPLMEPPLAASVKVSSDKGVVAVETGAAAFRIATGMTSLVGSVSVTGAPVIDAERTGLRVEGDDGAVYSAIVEELGVEETGPLRARVRTSGRLRCPGREDLLTFVCYLDFYAGLATVRASLTLTNPRRAGHPGGCWDLGGEGSVLIRDASLTLALPAGAGRTGVLFSAETGSPYGVVNEDIELYQDSSGGENWRSTNHINRNRQVPLSFRGYRLRVGEKVREGLRATPVVILESPSGALGVAVPHFWHNFPKAIEAGRDSLILRLWPRQSADLHEIQGGEQKTHVFYLAFGRDNVTEEALDWCRSPLVACPSPEWSCASGALPHVVPQAEDPNQDYLRLVYAALDGGHSFEHKREVVDEYGWRHFGDIYADHEAVLKKDGPPLVSHYNNQYDGVLGMGLQFLRSGDARWFGQMQELAWHVIDIDVYHCDCDKSAYNQGMFWHTCHYIDADTGTHRAYPARHTQGGGPSAGHLYTSGLLLDWFMTGNPLARQTVLDLGDYVIQADDGTRTVFRWLDRGPTGHVSDSGGGYHGPGRASANAINALLDAHRISGQPRYLAKAEELIRRCIHPRDDFDRLQLEDAERRWFYTMFLQSLGKYLDAKSERNELDPMYAYSRESLLHYARWMAENECPYLDKPEKLEYPTETWAAQDMRKSEVFCFAAKHAGGAERARFVERAEFFFRYVTRTLSAMPTRTLARPVVLLLTNGLMHSYLRKHPDVSAPPPAVSVNDFGHPTTFVPQKTRAIRKFKALCVAGAAIVAVGATLWMLLRLTR